LLLLQPFFCFLFFLLCGCDAAANLFFLCAFSLFPFHLTARQFFRGFSSFPPPLCSGLARGFSPPFPSVFSSQDNCAVSLFPFQPFFPFPRAIGGNTADHLSFPGSRPDASPFFRFSFFFSFPPPSLAWMISGLTLCEAMVVPLFLRAPSPEEESAVPSSKLLSFFFSQRGTNMLGNTFSLPPFPSKLPPLFFFFLPPFPENRQNWQLRRHCVLFSSPAPPFSPPSLPLVKMMRQRPEDSLFLFSVFFFFFSLFLFFFRPRQGEGYSSFSPPAFFPSREWGERASPNIFLFFFPLPLRWFERKVYAARSFLSSWKPFPPFPFLFLLSPPT